VQGARDGSPGTTGMRGYGLLQVRLLLTAGLLAWSSIPLAHGQSRPRARALGIVPGLLSPGTHNAITDVHGVRVGHATVIEGDSVRTGVTAILPHPGNLFFDRVPAAIHVGNGFGKLVGSTQVVELGELETPILLTCTLCVWKAADALVAHLLDQPGMQEVRSINPVVGETNDGYALNAIRQRPLLPAHVRAAMDGAKPGPVVEGSVGAGTGTIAYGWKGGIGTSSRMTATGNRWIVGVLVQSNFGGDLHILGVPVGRALGRNGVRARADPQGSRGSIMIVVATNAPLSDRNLRRLGSRAMLGVGRTGSVVDNGSGDYVISFSTHPGVRRRAGDTPRAITELANEEMSELFQATVEATEEAIYNSLFTATSVSSRRGTVEAIPVAEVLAVLRSHRALK
jgi:D-aminopeptidase